MAEALCRRTVPDRQPARSTDYLVGKLSSGITKALAFDVVVQTTQLFREKTKQNYTLLVSRMQIIKTVRSDSILSSHCLVCYSKNGRICLGSLARHLPSMRLELVSRHVLAAVAGSIGVQNLSWFMRDIQ